MLTLNAVVQTWHRQHPGRPVTEAEFGELSNNAYSTVASIDKAQSGFRKTAIYPHNRDVFSDEDFLAAMATDQPIGAESGQLSSASLTEQSAEGAHSSSGTHEAVSTEDSSSRLDYVRVISTPIIIIIIKMVSSCELYPEFFAPDILDIDLTVYYPLNFALRMKASGYNVVSSSNKMLPVSKLLFYLAVFFSVYRPFLVFLIMKRMTV